MLDADYIIVGAGSAGCVVANRLSAQKQNTVTLIEAGGSDRQFWIQLPIGYGKTFYDKRVNWKYSTEPITAFNDRSSYWPRGKTLGGSSSINAMVYVRGQQRDFNDWEACGNPGWGANDVLPYFERIEAHSEHSSDEQSRLHITDPRNELHPLIDTWLDVATELGYEISKDFNRDRFEGLGHYHITTKDGRRNSTARAFLRPALGRPNLQLITHAHVIRVVFDGKKAIGMDYIQDNQLKSVRARREVILCAGAINTPQLLELSGVGDGALLQKFGIDVVSDNPAVGANLQDHIGVDYIYRSNVPTLNDVLTPLSGKIKVALRYLFARKGLLSLSVNQGGGFIRSNQNLTYPNLQLYFNPISYTRAPVGTRPLIKPDRFSAYILSVQPCRPTSRGTLHIQSPDPFVQPRIAPNYLATAEDTAEALEGCHLLRRLASTKVLSRITAEELTPGPEIQSDEQILDDFRNRADTIFHPVGTCAMGSDAQRCVVDGNLKVHGLQQLRVIDASIFPNLTSGNTNAPTLMVAEKGAEHILRDNP